MKRLSQLGQTIALSAALGLSLNATAAEVNCAAFAKEIDDRLKQIATLRAADGTQEASVANELKLIEINLTIAMKLNCPALRTPIRADIYAKAAFACRRVWTPAIADTGVCDRSNWKAE